MYTVLVFTATGHGISAHAHGPFETAEEAEHWMHFLKEDLVKVVAPMIRPTFQPD